MDTNEKLATTIEHLASACAELLRERKDASGDREEQLLVQLAGCGAAALGATRDVAKPEDYGWSPAYAEVLALRGRHDERLGRLTAAECRARDAEAELYLTKAQLADLSERFGNMRDVLQLTRGEVDTLREALRASNEVADFRAVVAHYRTRLGASPDVRAPEDVVKAYTERVEQRRQARIDELEGIIKAGRAENERRSGVINDLRAEIEAMRGSRDRMEVERNNARNNEQGAVRAHQETLNEVASLRDEIARFRDEVGSKQSAIRGHIDRHTRLCNVIGVAPGEFALDAAQRVMIKSKEYEARIKGLERLLSEASVADE